MSSSSPAQGRRILRRVWEKRFKRQSDASAAPNATAFASVVMALFVLISLVAAAISRADTTDDKFLAALRSQGIMDHVSRDHAIAAGRLVCFEIDNGKSPADVANEVLNSSSMPEFHAGFFVGASIDAYCPQHKAEIASS